MKLLFFLYLFFIITVSVSTQAQTSPSSNISPSTLSEAASETPRLWNFDNADIKTVINAVSKETGKNFIIDPRVQGKVTLIASTSMDKDEIYQVFLTLLQTYGFLVIPDGHNVYKIVPDTVAKYQEVPAFMQAGDNVKGSAVMVKVIPVHNGTAEHFVTLLRPLLPTSSEISAYVPNNALIISSTANKIGEIEKIIDSLDVPSEGAVEIVALHNANANDAATAVKAILPPSAAGRTPLLIAADSNSNTILISGSPQERENIKDLIRKIDRLTIEAAKINNTVVINLHYLNAKDLAPVLQNVASGSSASVAGTSVGESNAESATTLSNIRSLYNAATDTSKSSSASSESAAASAAYTPSVNIAGVHIQAEPATNSLIIGGTPAQIRAMRAVIARLDIRPQQVLVEALIAEVNENTMQKLGVQWGTFPPSDLKGGVSGTATPTTNAGGAPIFDNGFSGVTGGLGVGIVQAGRIRTLITALKNDASTNILSTPSLVVLDNQEASIEVGQNISFNNGSLVNTASNSTVLNSVQPTDVALTLKVTPQISRSEGIRLKLEHENDVPTAESKNGNPVVNKSKFSTDVMINSGQILVIGGLISNDTEESVQKVPLLGNIPLLGRLFQYHDDSVTKKNLLIFLRPIVLSNQNVESETFSRYSTVRGLQLDRQKHADIIVPKGANAVLPPWPRTPLPEPFSE